VRSAHTCACEGGPSDVEECDVVRSCPGLDEVGDDLAHHRHELEPVAGEAAGQHHLRGIAERAEHERVVRLRAAAAPIEPSPTTRTS
jgi:hypothetical protein